MRPTATLTVSAACLSLALLAACHSQTDTKGGKDAKKDTGPPIVDVLVARAVPTVDGQRVAFDEVWGGRRAVPLTGDVAVFLPSHADLIQTKRFAARPKDLEDIRLLHLTGPEGES